jgi:hypothetical protein
VSRRDVAVFLSAALFCLWLVFECLSVACTPAVEQAGAAAPVDGEAVFLASEVACLLAHQSAGLPAANAACGIDALRATAVASAADAAKP